MACDEKPTRKDQHEALAAMRELILEMIEEDRADLTAAFESRLQALEVRLLKRVRRVQRLTMAAITPYPRPTGGDD